MSKITIYNDSQKDAQIVVLNHLTQKPGVFYPLPISDPDTGPVQIDLGNGDMIIITSADAV